MRVQLHVILFRKPTQDVEALSLSQLLLGSGHIQWEVDYFARFPIWLCGYQVVPNYKSELARLGVPIHYTRIIALASVPRLGLGNAIRARGFFAWYSVQFGLQRIDLHYLYAFLGDKPFHFRDPVYQLFRLHDHEYFGAAASDRGSIQLRSLTDLNEHQK